MRVESWVLLEEASHNREVEILLPCQTLLEVFLKIAKVLSAEVVDLSVKAPISIIAIVPRSFEAVPA